MTPAFTRFVPAFLALALLAACGGGNGSGTSTGNGNGQINGGPNGGIVLPTGVDTGPPTIALDVEPDPLAPAPVVPAGPAPSPVATPVVLPAAPAGIAIAPLGTPRILASNAALMTRLRTLLGNNDAAARRFQTMVDNQIAGANYWGFANWNAALLSQITGTAGYCTYAVGNVDAFVAAEEARIAANTQPVIANDNYLEVGWYIQDLALTYDWCRPQMDAAMRTRWVDYANQSVFNAWYRHTKNMTPPSPFVGVDLQPVTDYTPWGANNPRNNYYYSFLTATMLLGLSTHGENAQAPGWLGQFRTAKIQDQLLPVFNNQLMGGGSREGTGYGTALRSLFMLYFWWEQSTGERLADLTPHTRASLAALMHTIVPTLDRYVTTGDQARDSTGMLFDYQLDYLKILMQLYPNDALSGIAKSLMAQATPSATTSQFMYYADYLYHTGAEPARPLADLATAYHASGNGMFAMRGSWSRDAAYANFICGPNDESHAHDDQGSFVLFRNQWLAIDANMQMTSGLAQTEHVHNLVRVLHNGAPVSQYRYGDFCVPKALADTPEYTYVSADLMPVHQRHGAGKVTRIERRFLFVKPGVFVVFDPVVTAGAGKQRVFTLNLPAAPLTWSNDMVRFVSGPNVLDLHKVAPATAGIHVTDWRAVTPLDWSQVPKAGATAHRVDVVDAAGNASDFLHVLSTNGAVVSQPVPDNAAGQTGVRFDLDDGRTLVVRFNNVGEGGTIEIRRAGASVLFQQLPTAVTGLPLLAN